MLTMNVLKNSTDTYKFPSANAVDPPKLASVAERFATLKKKPIEPELFSKQLASNINEVIGREILTETHISQTRGRPVDAIAELCHLRYYIFTVGSKAENLKKEIKVGGWTPYIGAEEPLTDLDEAFQDALLSIGTRNGSQISTTLGEILETIYERDFIKDSYGFRPNRSCHQALRTLNVTVEKDLVSYIVEADIKGFFTNMDQNWTMKFLDHRIGDKLVLRMIKRFLRAGVLENGELFTSDEGTPQGGLSKAFDKPPYQK